MTPPLRDDERRDPLPGLLELPGHLLRQLGPRGRRIAIAVAALSVVATLLGILLLAPQIDRSKRRDAQAEEARSERLAQQRLERLRREVRPRHGRAPGLAVSGQAPGEALRLRRALVRELERAVLADARGRVESGELRIQVRTGACEQFPRRAAGLPPEERLAVHTGRYECLAVTSRIAGGGPGAEGQIGYPYRALANFRTGAYSWCKISGRPGEGALRGMPEVRVPRACGGT